MSWEAVTALGTAFTALVIVASTVVSFGQLNQFRAQRRDIGTTAAAAYVRLKDCRPSRSG